MTLPDFALISPTLWLLGKLALWGVGIAIGVALATRWLVRRLDREIATMFGEERGEE